MPGEAAVARIGLAVLALHVVDDRFAQPEPGTSAADHLTSGLVPLAALALLAWRYPRLRPGVRATLAILVGILGAVAGAADGLWPAVAAGPSGDDVTGLAALVAGLALVALGTAVLWRTRRRDEPARRRYARRAAVGVAAALAAYLVVFPVATAYWTTHAARPDVPEPDLGAPPEDVTLITTDGLELAGWYVPSRNGAAVIAFPGRSEPQPHARMLARNGYGVLLIDRRGEGDSEGDPNGLGWGGARDVEAAVAYLAGRPDVEEGRVGGLGLSVGGELLIEAAARTPQLRAVVAEGAGVRSLREQRHVGGVDLGLPTWAVITAATALFADRGPPPDLMDLAGRIAPRPLLVIHATEGQGGEELAARYVAAAGGTAERWEVAEGGHTGALEALPREYERRVVGFFDRALARPAPTAGR